MVRQVLSVFAAALLGTTAIVSAQGEEARVESGGIGLSVPKNSPFRLISAEPDRSFATFEGRFIVSGPYSVGCRLTDDEKCSLDDLSLMIEPDVSLLAQFPQWDFHDSGRPLLGIRDAAPFLKAHLDAPTLLALESRQMEEVNGYASIVVEDLNTGIECDSYWYSARFVALATVKEAPARAPEGHVGCS